MSSTRIGGSRTLAAGSHGAHIPAIMSPKMLSTPSRTRTLAVAVATAVLGIWLIASGLVAFSGSRPADTTPSGTPSIETLAPTTGPGASSASAIPASTAPGPIPTPTPTVSSSPSRTAVATRVTVPALGIDLPVVAANDGYPYCDVAMYQPALGQPGQGRASYLYAHARVGMFGPIYERAIVAGTGRSMLGMSVFVYTSDDLRFEYRISEVRIHQLTLDDATNATVEQLWLQTSEGPQGTPGKTQLVALPVGIAPVDDAAAHPTPHPVTCG